MRSHASKLAILAVLCLGLIAAAKLIRVEIFVFDPDDNYNYVSDIELTVTAYDQNDQQLTIEHPLATPAGPNAHARFALPGDTAYMMVDVFDVDDNCTQSFGPLNINGRAHVGGQAYFLRLSECEAPVMPAPVR